MAYMSTRGTLYINKAATVQQYERLELDQAAITKNDITVFLLWA